MFFILGHFMCYYRPTYSGHNLRLHVCVSTIFNHDVGTKECKLKDQLQLSQDLLSKHSQGSFIYVYAVFSQNEK